MIDLFAFILKINVKFRPRSIVLLDCHFSLCSASALMTGIPWRHIPTSRQKLNMVRRLSKYSTKGQKYTGLPDLCWHASKITAKTGFRFFAFFVHFVLFKLDITQRSLVRLTERLVGNIQNVISWHKYEDIRQNMTVSWLADALSYEV